MTQAVTKIAVISDIHANNDALNYVLSELNNNVDLFIILGDLLTYGCQPKEVLATLTFLNNNNNCIFIKGNHDQVYFDRQIGSETKSYPLKGFVKESVDWTEAEIADVNFYSLFDWRENYSIGPVYFAHANPYKYGDWRYVEGADCCKEAATRLRDKKCEVGIFGHSHRKYSLECGKDDVVNPFLGELLPIGKKNIYLLNPGSVGQPRGEGFSFMMLEIMSNRVKFELVRFEIDIFNSIQKINQTGMSAETKQRLVSFLRS